MKAWVVAAATAQTMFACDVNTSRRIERNELELLNAQVAIIRLDNEAIALKRQLVDAADEIDQLKHHLADFCPSGDPQHCR
jgi:hypothetical protein